MPLIAHATAALRLTAYLVWTLLCLPPYLVLLAMGRGAGLARFYWRIVRRLVGFKLVVIGEIAREAPVLYVCNHVSYLDILVLGGLLPARFVAKSEVAGWPGIGFFAKLGRTVFIHRRPVLAASQTALLASHLKDRESLIIFPEGTSTDGNRVLSFKSALFSAADVEVDGRLVLVQPVTLAYTRLNGLPMGRAFRPLFAWYGDMTLASHLWQALGQGRVQVEVEFHPPVRQSDYATRKSLALHCQRQVRHGHSRALSGRRQQALATKTAH